MILEQATIFGEMATSSRAAASQHSTRPAKLRCDVSKYSVLYPLTDQASAKFHLPIWHDETREQGYVEEASTSVITHLTVGPKVMPKASGSF